jgi:hypothetical protein
MTRKTIAEYRAEWEDLRQQVEDRVPRAPSFEVWSQGPPCDQTLPVSDRGRIRPIRVGVRHASGLVQTAFLEFILPWGLPGTSSPARSTQTPLRTPVTVRSGPSNTIN